MGGNYYWYERYLCLYQHNIYTLSDVNMFTNIDINYDISKNPKNYYQQWNNLYWISNKLKDMFIIF